MYSREEVRRLLKETEDEEILAQHTKAQLEQMHGAVYGHIGHPSGWRKQDILRSLRKYFASIERAQCLKP